MRKRISHLMAMALCFSFLLGIRDGRVALWKGEDPEPVAVSPWPVSMLPKDARDALANGIQVESVEELQNLIDRYLS
jgi:hypothetical protein